MNMSNYDNTNTGALFTNEKKADNQPDYKGKINVNGKDLEIAAWIKTSKAGSKFMSLKVSEPYVKPEGNVPPLSSVVETDDLPF
jgi:uncharacterized protein (DUF736 family)